MQVVKTEVDAVESVALRSEVIELMDLELALVGGGQGEVLLG